MARNNPKFKVGDIIKWGQYEKITITQINLISQEYHFGSRGTQKIENVDKTASFANQSKKSNKSNKTSSKK
jgi:hypothetical protein